MYDVSIFPMGMGDASPHTIITAASAWKLLNLYYYYYYYLLVNQPSSNCDVLRYNIIITIESWIGRPHIECVCVCEYVYVACILRIFKGKASREPKRH